MRKLSYVLVALAAVALVLGAAACKKKVEAPATAKTAATAETVAKGAPETPPVLSAEAQKLPPGTKVVAMELEKGGSIEFELLDKEAPKTAAHFEMLLNDKLYDGLPIHRVEGFVIQTGDDEKAEQLHPGITLEAEKDKRKCVRGAVSMARAMAPGAKEYGATSPTEFFILKQDSTYLDKDFTVFGMVVSGLDVLDKIQPNDVIKRIRVVTVGAAPATVEKK